MRSATWTERRQQWASFPSSASSAMVSSPSSSKNSWTALSSNGSSARVVTTAPSNRSASRDFISKTMLTAQEMWPALTHDADERKAYNSWRAREKHTTSFLFSFCWLKVGKCLIHSYVNSRHVYLTYTFVSSLVLFTTCFSERGFLKLLFILCKTWRR